jgi:hypothetical protein
MAINLANLSKELADEFLVTFCQSRYGCFVKFYLQSPKGLPNLLPGGNLVGRVSLHLSPHAVFLEDGVQDIYESISRQQTSNKPCRERLGSRAHVHIACAAS